MNNMRKKLTLLALCIVVVIAGIGCASTGEVQTEAEVTVSCECLNGEWIINQDKTDMAAVNEAFPGAMEFGNKLQLSDDGSVFWFVGAEGGSGTYLIEDKSVVADITRDVDGNSEIDRFEIAADSEQCELVMNYNGMTIYWCK